MERARRFLALVAPVAAGLALAAPAAGALEVRLSVVPTKPRATKRTVVEVRPYWTRLKPDGTCCRLVPADTSYPFRVEAVSPRGRIFRVPVRRTRNRYVWAGSLFFRSPGRWTVRAPQWGPDYSRRAGGRPRIRVLVAR